MADIFSNNAEEGLDAITELGHRPINSKASIASCDRAAGMVDSPDFVTTGRLKADGSTSDSVAPAVPNDDADEGSTS